MRRYVFTALMYAASLPFIGCSDNSTNRDNAANLTERPRNEILECAMTSTTSMNGEAVKPKVTTLWLDSVRKAIFRADEFAAGNVVRNGYSTNDVALTPELKQGLVDRKLPNDWKAAYEYRHFDTHKVVLTNEDETRGLLITLAKRSTSLASEGGELAQLQCRRVERSAAPANVELVAAPPPPPTPKPTTVGCADKSVEQTYGVNMVGCAGRVSFLNRADLCAPGWRVCTALEWTQRFGTQVPTYNYWTDDHLNYAGSGPGNCSVSKTAGSSCSPSPMRVCASTYDAMGNQCNWTQCGLDSTTNQYFGGCGHPTASTLCCF